MQIIGDNRSNYQLACMQLKMDITSMYSECPCRRPSEFLAKILRIGSESMFMPSAK